MSESLQSKLQQIDQLKAEIDAMEPMTEKSKDDLWRKYRLEWNYNSNHIEGNTLTYGQTKLLLIFGETTGNHSIREYEEMKAHDVAIKTIQEWANDEVRSINETDIRSLNEIILVEPFYSPAQTVDGQPTKRLITPGEYKEHPNHVETATGEIFKYAEPNEVPIKMQELLEEYEELSKEGHPVHVAAWLHYALVRIHPFDDGNGRVCRLVMNYHLLKNDLAPVIIKSDDKKSYFAALQRADAGDLESFIEYIVDQELWSLELMLNATKGESVDEEEDWKKEVSILKNKLNIDNSLKLKDIDLIASFTQENIVTIYRGLTKQIEEFHGLFHKLHIRLSFIGKNGSGPIYVSLKNINENQSSISSKEWLSARILIHLDKLLSQDLGEVSFHEYIDFKFNQLHVELKYLNQTKRFSYSDRFSQQTISEITNSISKEFVENIKNRAL